MSEGFRIQDFTLEKIYDAVIDTTAADEITQVLLGDDTAWIRNGAVEVVQAAGSATKWIQEGVSAGEDALAWAVLTPSKAVINGIETAESAIMEVVDYISPTSASLNSFEDMGNEMDRLIKDNLFLQFFGLTYTDYLCSAFCLVVSLLSCEQRTQLYRDIISFQRSLVAIDTAVESLASIATNVNVGIAGANSVLLAAEGILNGNLSDAVVAQETGQSAARGIASVQAAIENIDAIVDTIDIAMKVAEAGRIIEPIVQYSGIWNLARNILFEMQATAMEMAEEALMTLIQPVEDLIEKIRPSNCLNNSGGIIFNKILGMIRGYKNWLVTQIGMLFTEFYTFSKLMDTFNYRSKSMLELTMFMNALKTLSTRFGDLAIVCGVEPCYDDDNPAPQAAKGRPIANPVGADSRTITFADIPTHPDDNIEDIAEKMKDILQAPIDDVYVTNNEIITIYDALTGAPDKLLDMASEISLGNNYDIAISRETSAAKIVHTTKRYCGE